MRLQVCCRSPSPPKNEAADRTAELLALARDEYMRAVPDAESPAVLVIANATESNLYDQYYLRIKLVTSQRVPTIWRTLPELAGGLSLRGGRVFLGGTEVRTAGPLPCETMSVGVRVLLQNRLRPVPVLGPGMGDESSAGRQQGAPNS